MRCRLCAGVRVNIVKPKLRAFMLVAEGIIIVQFEKVNTTKWLSVHSN